MDQETTTSSSHSTSQEIIRMSRLAKEIQELIFKEREEIPEKVSIKIKQLSKRLENFIQITSQHDMGKDNLLALVGISQVINSSLELPQVLQIVMDTIINLTNAERGFLMLRDKNKELSMRVARNWEKETLNQTEFNISQTIVNRVFSGSKPILTTNAQEDPRFGDQASIIAYQLRSIMCVPLVEKHEPIGVIYVDNRFKTGIFSEGECEMLAAFANQAAVAIENANLFESVQLTLSEVTELKNLMDRVFGSIASGVITIDTNENIILCNLAAEKILDIDSASQIGNDLSKTLPSLYSKLSPFIEKVRKTDKNILNVEIDSILPGRGKTIFSCNFSPLKDAARTTRGIAIVLDDLTDKKRLEAQRRLFERMVSPAVIDQINPDQLNLGGKRSEITILFSDLRDFTKFSESVPPEELMTVLNQYLDAAVEAVLAHDGTIDKFSGDAIMAWFNAPIIQPDHTLRAVRAAMDIQAAIKSLKTRLPIKYHLSFGTGIHIGEAVLGLIGNEQRLDYTAIGDSVNTAKRIQEAADPGITLISDQVFQYVSDEIKVQEINEIMAKGKSQPLQVYEVIGLKG